MGTLILLDFLMKLHREMAMTAKKICQFPVQLHTCLSISMNQDNLM